KQRVSLTIMRRTWLGLLDRTRRPPPTTRIHPSGRVFVGGERASGARLAPGGLACPTPIFLVLTGSGISHRVPTLGGPRVHGGRRVQEGRRSLALRSLSCFPESK